MQEVLLAKSAELLTASGNVPIYELLCLLSHGLAEIILSLRPKLVASIAVAEEPSHTLASTERDPMAPWESAFSMSFHTNSQTTRDRTYCVRSIIPGGHLIRVDYPVSDEQVLADVASAMLDEVRTALYPVRIDNHQLAVHKYGMVMRNSGYSMGRTIDHALACLHLQPWSALSSILQLQRVSDWSLPRLYWCGLSEEITQSLHPRAKKMYLGLAFALQRDGTKLLIMWPAYPPEGSDTRWSLCRSRYMLWLWEDARNTEWSFIAWSQFEDLDLVAALQDSRSNEDGPLAQSQTSSLVSS